MPPCRWLIVDGFSLLHRDEKLAAVLQAGRLFEARRLLVQGLDRIAGALAARTTVVFDGRREGGSGDEAIDVSIEVVFSPSHLTADSVIERLVQAATPAAGILVVTSDRLERETVGAAGAESMSCGDFLDLCRREEAHLRRRAQPASGAGPAPRPTLGDFFPKA